jgi:O-antigen/teichoic acid export membrane protein
MRESLRKVLANPMLRGSAVLWVGMMAANVSNYAFHLLMGRFLGPINYGVLASIFSVLYYLMVPVVTITTIVMKYTAEFDVEGAPGKIHSLFTRLTKQLAVVSVALFVLLAAASPVISRFLKIDSIWPMLILSTMMLFGYVLPVNRGIMQGLQKFGTLSINLVLETILKLSIGITLVLAGYMVNGAVFGVVVAMFIAYVFSFLPLRGILRVKDKAVISVRAMWKYSVPVFIALFCLNSYYSVDIILVKHFLSPVEAGHYSGLSILGKIVVFACLAIVGVMFPMVAGRHKADQKHSHLLGYTLGLITLISGSIVLAYSVAPKFIISLLFGTKYLAVAPYLGWFGLAMLLLALSSALANYYLAIDKTKCVAILVGVAIMQIVFLWVFHSSLSQIVNVMVGTMALLFVSLSAFYFFAVRGVSGKEPEEPPVVTLPTEF